MKNNRIQESVPNNSVTKVVELMDPQLRILKEEVVSNLFSRSEVEAILDVNWLHKQRRIGRSGVASPRGSIK